MALRNRGSFLDRWSQLQILMGEGTMAAKEEGKHKRRDQGKMEGHPDNGRRMVAETGRRRTTVATGPAVTVGKGKRWPGCLPEHLSRREPCEGGDRESGGCAGKED